MLSQNLVSIDVLFLRCAALRLVQGVQLLTWRSQPGADSGALLLTESMPCSTTGLPHRSWPSYVSSLATAMMSVHMRYCMRKVTTA